MTISDIRRVYKGLKCVDYPMESKLKQRHLVKACYGTGEWSANSGICRNCKWQDDCGKIEGKLKVKGIKS